MLQLRQERETISVYGLTNSFSLSFSEVKRTIEVIDGFQIYIIYIHIFIFVYFFTPHFVGAAESFDREIELLLNLHPFAVLSVGNSTISRNTHILNSRTHIAILIGMLTAQSIAIRLPFLIAKTIKSRMRVAS